MREKIAKMKKGNIVITDNFLPEEQFAILRDNIINEESGDPFPWYYRKTKSHQGEDPSTSPGQFSHTIYFDGHPTSPFYQPHFYPIREKLNCAILIRIKLNLNPRLPEPFYSEFHTDIGISELHEDLMAHSKTSILYMNTNNGYTELENGEEDTRIESVANRLVTFPTSTRHRGVTQTDEQTRIMVNFNYFTHTYIL